MPEEEGLPRRFAIFLRLSIIVSEMKEPILYVKQGCPWCADALAYFEDKQIKLNVVDVRNDPRKMDELLAVSGQTLTPTLKNGAFVVADFDLQEFEQALSANPEEAEKLGFQKTVSK